MGQEISSSSFNKQDFERFEAALREETRRLETWFVERRFVEEEPVGGFELEAWLVDEHMRPAPINERYLARLGNPLVVPELSQYNVELNTPAQPLSGPALRRMHNALAGTWRSCQEGAQPLGAHLLMIGILPTLEERDLTLEHMSQMLRYRALNEQVLRLRRGVPLQVDIRGPENLRLVHSDVMLEAATTSFQIHLQVSQRDAVRCYNAAQVLSAPMVAATANSPFLFGKALWAETRIPLFEQAVAVAGSDSPPRVSFGSGYAKESVLECFLENLEQVPVLLPTAMEGSQERLPHLRLHNGTIWRWNRPLIGFDAGGRPHLRVEHRVVSAGPSVPDAIANAALFFGLVHALAMAETPPETRLSFADARANFYVAARQGLDATLKWLDGRRLSAQDLLLQELIPAARVGLARLGLDESDARAYLGIIEARVRTRRSGRVWQMERAAACGRDMARMTAAYLAHQERSLPVHEWGRGC